MLSWTTDSGCLLRLAFFCFVSGSISWSQPGARLRTPCPEKLCAPQCDRGEVVGKRGVPGAFVGGINRLIQKIDGRTGVRGQQVPDIFRGHAATVLVRHAVKAVGIDQQRVSRFRSGDRFLAMEFRSDADGRRLC